MSTIPLHDDHSYLFYGDNLDILRNRLADDSVDLCYIDPPFNSKRSYSQIYTRVGHEDRAQAQAFVDTWVWGPESDQGFQEILSNPHGRFTPQMIALLQGLHGVLGSDSLLAYLVHMALRITEIHRVLKPTATSAPSRNCPWAPMFNTPPRKAIPAARPVSSSGQASAKLLVSG